MTLVKEREGELLILGETLLTSIFPIVITLSFVSLSGATSVFWSTIFAALFFAAFLTIRKRWHELLDVRLWKYSLGIALFIGVILYGLYFIALEYTSSGNVAIIMQLQVLTSFILFNVLKGEAIPFRYLLGAGFMLSGALIVLARGWSGVNPGDLLLVLGTIGAPIGNYFQQKARTIASSESVMFLRSVLTALILFPILILLKQSLESRVLVAALPFVLVNGVLLLGIAKVFWIEGIHRISVTKATALSCIGPLFTLIFAYVILGDVPTIYQLLALLPFTVGTLLLTDTIKLRNIRRA